MTGSRAGSGVPAPAAVAARLGAAADRMLNAGKRPAPSPHGPPTLLATPRSGAVSVCGGTLSCAASTWGRRRQGAPSAAVTLHPRRPRPPACSAAEFAQIHPRAIRPFRADQYPPREQIRAPGSGRSGGRTASRSGASPDSPNSRRLERWVTSMARPAAQKAVKQRSGVLQRHVQRGGERGGRRRGAQRPGSPRRLWSGAPCRQQVDASQATTNDRGHGYGPCRTPTTKSARAWACNSRPESPPCARAA